MAPTLSLAGQHAFTVIDPLRITVAVNGLGLSGFQVGQILEEQYGVVMELATPQVGCAHTPDVSSLH